MRFGPETIKAARELPILKQGAPCAFVMMAKLVAMYRDEDGDHWHIVLGEDDKWYRTQRV